MTSKIARKDKSSQDETQVASTMWQKVSQKVFDGGKFIVT